MRIRNLALAAALLLPAAAHAQNYPSPTYKGIYVNAMGGAALSWNPNTQSPNGTTYVSHIINLTNTRAAGNSETVFGFNIWANSASDSVGFWGNQLVGASAGQSWGSAIDSILQPGANTNGPFHVTQEFDFNNNAGTDCVYHCATLFLAGGGTNQIGAALQISVTGTPGTYQTAHAILLQSPKLAALDSVLDADSAPISYHDIGTHSTAEVYLTPASTPYGILTDTTSHITSAAINLGDAATYGVVSQGARGSSQFVAGGTSPAGVSVVGVYSSHGMSLTDTSPLGVEQSGTYGSTGIGYYQHPVSAQFGFETGGTGIASAAFNMLDTAQYGLVSQGARNTTIGAQIVAGGTSYAGFLKTGNFAGASEIDNSTAPIGTKLAGTYGSSGIALLLQPTSSQYGISSVGGNFASAPISLLDSAPYGELIGGTRGIAQLSLSGSAQGAIGIGGTNSIDTIGLSDTAPYGTLFNGNHTIAAVDTVLDSTPITLRAAPGQKVCLNQSTACVYYNAAVHKWYFTNSSATPAIVASLDDNGNLIVKGTVTQNGTP